ncbi:MAG: hypothetical protein U1E76_12760 [Planctomycetota bacterium]
MDDAAAKQEAADPISGEWSGKVTAEFIPAERGHFTMNLKMSGDKITGTIDSEQGDSEVKSGSYNAATGAVELYVMSERGEATWHGKLTGTKLAGELEVFGGQFRLEFEAERKATAPASTTATTPPPAPAAPAKPEEPAKTEALAASDQGRATARQVPLPRHGSAPSRPRASKKGACTSPSTAIARMTTNPTCSCPRTRATRGARCVRICRWARRA